MFRGLERVQGLGFRGLGLMIWVKLRACWTPDMKLWNSACPESPIHPLLIQYTLEQIRDPTVDGGNLAPPR